MLMISLLEQVRYKLGNPIHYRLITVPDHEKMLGLKKEDAGSSLIACKKKKKKLVRQEEEWGGIDAKD